MRVMAYLGSLVLLFALWGAWLAHRKKLAKAKWFLWSAPWVIVLPFLINTAGWMLTENGRQPWIVQGLMLTKNGVTTSNSALELWLSLIIFVALYAALGAVDVFLMVHYARKSLAEGTFGHGGEVGGDGDDDDDQADTEREPALAY
jgi:cytochrome d ubiquinol oxidase subunit I